MASEKAKISEVIAQALVPLGVAFNLTSHALENNGHKVKPRDKEECVGT